ncbi:MAG TPA: hypothetical protein VGR87_00645 [Candidatus Limnocylindria bacterium]|nr:hypothetical protein [Candidatus Limnocylindria bacterium]
MAGTNFNYQVALKEGLKNLQQGRLRQAEQSFRYLVDKFPSAEGGYRGLAKVHFEQEDRTAALRILREGAAALTKSGERSAAIGLLREAVALDPRDLATHRRLAAALALAGDLEAAVQEYARFIRELRDGGEMERAKNEVGYAKGQLKDAPGFASLEGIAAGTRAPVDQASRVDEPAPKPAYNERVRQETMRAAFGEAPANRTDADPWTAPHARPAPETYTPPPPTEALTDASGVDPWAAPPPLAPMPSRFELPAPETVDADDPWTKGAPPVPAAPADTWTLPPVATDGPRPTAAPEPAMLPDVDGQPAAEADSAVVEAAAAQYLATRDPRAAGLALEAARRYIEVGHTDAASDLLLQLIAAGVADHDAQRLLVDVARTLGKREVAKTKCQLLAQALMLDGHNDLAAEVEALAQAE